MAGFSATPKARTRLAASLMTLGTVAVDLLVSAEHWHGSRRGRTWFWAGILQVLMLAHEAWLPRPLALTQNMASFMLGMVFGQTRALRDASVDLAFIVITSDPPIDAVEFGSNSNLPQPLRHRPCRNHPGVWFVRYFSVNFSGLRPRAWCALTRCPKVVCSSSKWYPVQCHLILL